jgi:very-short-patch-repair endonuclease
MDGFTHNVEDLIKIVNTKKSNIFCFIKKNFKKDIHYIVNKSKPNEDRTERRGGSNKHDILLTEKTFNLIKSSYNLRNSYIINISENIKCVNIIMCLENSTIGFIYNSFNSIFKIKRQFIIKKYKVDLYFPEYNLVIECDENNHENRDPLYEKTRENYITSLGNTIIRFNPNDEKFELSYVIKEVIKVLFSKNNLPRVIVVDFSSIIV